MRIFGACGLFFLLLLNIRGYAAELYIWTDENGVKHYSNVAPSENAVDFKKEGEMPKDESPQDTVAPLPPESRNEEGDTQAQPPAQTEAGETRNPESAPTGDQTAAPAAGGSGSNLTPGTQDELVAREKSISRELQGQLEQPGSREGLVNRERQRLTRAIRDYEDMPVSQFGSQKNKQRQVGYLKYRLQELENNPDEYFKYADSETD